MKKVILSLVLSGLSSVAFSSERDMQKDLYQKEILSDANIQTTKFALPHDFQENKGELIIKEEEVELNKHLDDNLQKIAELAKNIKIEDGSSQNGKVELEKK